MKIARTCGKIGGFTVFELLAVLVVVFLLALFAVPTVEQSRRDAREKLCAANLMLVGQAVGLYATDHDEAFPGNQHAQPSWVDSLQRYCGTNTFRCPEAVLMEGRVFKATLALNDFLARRPYGARGVDFSKRSSVPAPSQTLMFGEVEREYRAYDHFHFADRRENGYSAEAFAMQVAVDLHDGSANYLFVDGRVDALEWNNAARPKLVFRDSRFVNPAGATVGDVAPR